LTTASGGTDYRAQRVTRLGTAPGARDVRIVHELDGITADVEPKTLTRAGQSLWAAWQRHPAYLPPDLLLGLDAGGFLPTVALALASGIPYRLAWKLDLDLPDQRRFSEPHANRTDVFTYADFTGRRVLIVDDEITTGRTLANLVAVLREADAHVTGVACLIEDTSGGGFARLDELGVPLCTLTRL
jgi:adenine phosphoribosyltransferase